MIKSAKHYLLELPSALQEFISTESGFKLLFAGAKYNHNWNVTVTGVLASKPQSGLSINEGDAVAFNYRVVHDRIWDAKTNDTFNPLVNQEWAKVWQNGNGEILKMEQNQFLENEWICVLLDKDGELVDSFYGRYGQCENWVSKFCFNNENYTYRNLIPVDGKDYWKASKEDIYASITGGKLVAHNDYVILRPITQDLTKRVELERGVSLGIQKVLAVEEARGVVVASSDSAIEKDMVVGFAPNMAEKYDMWGKKYLLVKSRNIICKY